VSAQYAPHTHLATPVANIVLFSPNLFVFVPLLVGDFSISARETSGGFTIFCSKNLWAFFAENSYVFTLYWLLWISFFTFKETATCLPSHLMVFALRDVMQR
jgi:hypothetical protein